MGGGSRPAHQQVGPAGISGVVPPSTRRRERPQDRRRQLPTQDSDGAVSSVVIAASAPGEWRPLPLNADKARQMGRIIIRNG